MKASERNALFEKLRYELRMAEGFADEINSRSKPITEVESNVLGGRIQQCLLTCNQLVEGFKTDVPF